MYETHIQKGLRLVSFHHEKITGSGNVKKHHLYEAKIRELAMSSKRPLIISKNAIERKRNRTAVIMERVMRVEFFFKLKNKIKYFTNFEPTDRSAHTNPPL